MTTKKIWIYSLITILLAVALTTFLFVVPRQDDLIAKDAWQAVFLTNNQVYFGKIDSLRGDYITLREVFYLQSNQTINSDQKESGEINLIKLGSEIHGPENAMHISKNQIIFWENLKPNSKIVKIISDYR